MKFIVTDFTRTITDGNGTWGEIKGETSEDGIMVVNVDIKGYSRAACDTMKAAIYEEFPRDYMYPAAGDSDSYSDPDCPDRSIYTASYYYCM